MTEKTLWKPLNDDFNDTATSDADSSNVNLTSDVTGWKRVTEKKMEDVSILDIAEILWYKFVVYLVLLCGTLWFILFIWKPQTPQTTPKYHHEG